MFGFIHLMPRLNCFDFLSGSNFWKLLEHLYFVGRFAPGIAEILQCATWQKNVDCEEDSTEDSAFCFLEGSPELLLLIDQSYSS